MSDYFNVADIFGENVFNDTVMQERLPKKVYKKLHEVMDEGKELDLETADVIAHEMKEWAIEKGATHYTHWFQPLTGVTAEKHDSFITAPMPNGKVLMSFSGKELIKGEPDASSFPSGGLRATFEARGYTAWDCTSPAFVRQDAAGATLCIPTAFCSYTGEALDQKPPLLRSMEAIDTQSIRLLRLFGNTTSKKVTPSVGPEQEYFIVDRQKYLQRKDLIFTGRTLFGAMPPKGQEMDDHYFGAIRERIAAYMKDVNKELWKLGVAAKTQHNEVAPAQHELAPIYAECNVAVDHNQIIMETLKKVAGRHGLQCLLHEKPFAGVNGSGKHDNWSITTDDGINLLEPGKTPHENTQFLLVLACILKAVNVHADLLRESAADPGNDHRLGANEAPPAIISIFLGEQLEDVVDQLISTGEATHSLNGGKLDTGVSTLPELSKDATDRNRTSPFAFTGNKFEFRMVGSRDSISGSNVVLNTIVAEAFAEACDELEKAETMEAKIVHALDKMEALIQHNEADIATWLPLEYDLQMTYGEKECKADPYLAKLREVIRQISADKIASEGEERGQSYYIRKGVENMHLEEVAALLHRTDWAKDRTEELIRKSMENACPYGLFLSDCISEGGKDRQIGFARVLTDGVTTFYLMDLVIEEAYRGQGFGTIMMNQIMKENGHLYGMLHTQTAKGFYERYGFREIGNTKKTEEIYMEKPCG